MPQRRDAAEQVGGHGHRPSERRRGECNSRYGHRQEGGAGPAHAGAQRARRRLARRLPPPSRDGSGGQPALGLRPAGRGVRRRGEGHHPRIFRHHVRGLALPARGPLRQRGVWGFHGHRSLSRTKRYLSRTKRHLSRTKRHLSRAQRQRPNQQPARRRKARPARSRKASRPGRRAKGRAP